jgi:hypothetical protein
MNFAKGFVGCSLVAITFFLAAPDIARADDFMTLRYADGYSQKIRLERPSGSIRQIEFSEERRAFGRDELARPSITIISGTYGRNCGAQYGNATRDLAQVCDGRAACEYAIDVDIIGDPASGCPKDFIAEWQCGNNQRRESVSVSPEATGKRIGLRCPVR